MEITKELLKARGINYSGVKEDWVKEFYVKNIVNSAKNGDILYDANTFIPPEVDPPLMDMLLNSYRYPKLDLMFEFDKYKDLKNDPEVGRLAYYIMHVVMEERQKIIFACDYDCDGLTSGIVLYKYFKDVLKYEYVEAVPNQRKNGNGFNSELVQELIDMYREEPYGLIVTSDHSSNDEEAFVTIHAHTGNKVKIIVTDHHECPEDKKAKSVFGFVNPMEEDTNVFKGISGCHVAFNLCASLHDALGRPTKELYSLLPYVGISTVVDQMPLNNIHNRAIFKYGMNELAKREDYNFLKLEKLLNLPKIPKDKNISWNLGPFFNSGNRCNTERVIFKGCTEDIEARERYLVYAMQENNRRKSDQRKIVEQAIATVEEIYPDIDNTYGIAIEITTDYGIAGPVASQIGDTYNRPTIVFRSNKDNTILMGSGRAILDVNLLEILLKIQEEHPDVVVKAAGHMGACGIEIYSNKLTEFRSLLNDKVKEVLDGKLPVNSLDVITYINPTRVNLSLALQVESLAPFGNKWSLPVFITKMKFKQAFDMGRSKMCTFYRIGNSTINGIYSFDRNNGITTSNWKEKIVPNQSYYLVFTLVLGYYKNKYTVDMNIRDIIEA